MNRVAFAGLPIAGTTRVGTRAASAVARPVVDPRIARVLVQAFCLAVVVGAQTASFSGLQGLVLAQAVAAVGVFLVLRTTRPPVGATLRTLRVWGVGALLSLVAVTWLRDVLLPHDLRAAQLWVLGALVGLIVLGRMRDAFREAGTQIDAILATLPPPTAAARVDAHPTA